MLGKLCSAVPISHPELHSNTQSGTLDPAQSTGVCRSDSEVRDAADSRSNWNCVDMSYGQDQRWQVGIYSMLLREALEKRLHVPDRATCMLSLPVAPPVIKAVLPLPLNPVWS